MAGLVGKNRFHVYYQLLNETTLAPEGELIELGKFKEVGGLSSETDQTEWKTGADIQIIKIPGLTKFPSLSLKKGFDDDDEIARWRENIYNDGCMQKMDYRDLYIFVLGRDCKVNRVIYVEKAWPIKYEADNLDGMSNDPWIESADFAHSGWKYLRKADKSYEYAGQLIEAAVASYATTASGV